MNKNPLSILAVIGYIFRIMERFIDAHCHYNRDAFANYRGAGRFICNAVDNSDWGILLNAAARDSRICVALGLHPWRVSDMTPGWADELRRLLLENTTAMVGEIGLDAARDNFSMQLEAFVLQYRLAAELRRTANIHCFRAWDKMLHILKTAPMPPVVVSHRFSGNAQILASAQKMSDNIYFSFMAGDIFRQREVILQTPLFRILVETDGATPSPAKIQDAITQIAQIHGKSVTDMADIIYTNSLRVINNGQTA